MLRLERVTAPMGAARLEADVALAPGRRVAVLGASGAGKSTLLDVIAGFVPPVDGRITWRGQDLTGLGPEDRPVAILFQDGNLFPHLDLARNLGLALRPDGRRPDAAEAGRIDAALARVGLAGMGARRPGTLSGGQQGRAALARVLLMARPVLLLDEPFAALDPATKHEMLALVTEVSANLAALTLMVTHDPRDAERFAEEVIFVSDGAVAPPVSMARFKAKPPPGYTEAFGQG